MKRPRKKSPGLKQLGLKSGDLVTVTRDDGRKEIRVVRMAPWKLGHGEWVIGLEGITGGFLLTRCKPEKSTPDKIASLKKEPIKCVAFRKENCTACECGSWHSPDDCKGIKMCGGHEWRTCLIGGVVKCLPENDMEREKWILEKENNKQQYLTERLVSNRSPKMGCPD